MVSSHTFCAGRSWRGVGDGASRTLSVTISQPAFPLPTAGPDFGSWSMESSRNPTIRLPHLEILTIHEHVSLSWFFGCLELPQLQNLTFYTCFNPLPTDKASILILLDQIGAQSTKFTTNAQKFTTGDFVSCLELLPRLIHLVISSASQYTQTWDMPRYDAVATLNDIALARMTHSLPPNEDSDSLVPMLQCLEAHVDVEFSDTALRAFVLSRQSQSKLTSLPGRGKLRRVSIDFSRAQEINILPKLAEFIENGLEVSLSYTKKAGTGPFSPLEGLPVERVSRCL
ncbi:hypothetical protein K443DRAFT_12041 [Laccaria amethystina LaAM-08-1]|uniref:F-box domain-containing protein n=1 Tax=Laccaria amethystina LaAM-08-1 TaxID=1095629 RepID=A0A0C9WSC2_9AGAR|nr:hypothetical protein K443DRAFT_12041 [Laccaria amethystina LaAM-08-1]